MCLLRYTVFQLLLSSVDQVGVKTLSINITDNQLMFWLFLDPIVSIPFFDHEVQLACDDDDDDDHHGDGGGMARVLVQLSGRLVARLAGRWPCCCSRLVRSDNDHRR